MRENVIGIHFSNAEMANCWGKDTGNRWFNNIIALVPNGGDLCSSPEEVTIEITHDSSGCFVRIDAEDINAALNNVISKRYEDITQEIWDGLLTINEAAFIPADVFEEDEDEEALVESGPKMYGKYPCISRESLFKEKERFVKKFKSTILTNDKSKEEEITGTIYYVATIKAGDLIVDFTHLCQIYNAQRIADCVHDLDELGGCLSISQLDEKKYVLKWFRAYDIVRDKYLEFAGNVLSFKRQSYTFYPENQRIEIFNRTTEDWVHIESCHDGFWELILKSMEGVDYEDIKSSRARNSKAYDRWSAPESERLLSLYKHGSDIYSIAKIFNRSLTSIIIQLGKLLSEDMKEIKG